MRRTKEIQLRSPETHRIRRYEVDQSLDQCALQRINDAFWTLGYEVISTCSDDTEDHDEPSLMFRPGVKPHADGTYDWWQVVRVGGPHIVARRLRRRVSLKNLTLMVSEIEGSFRVERNWGPGEPPSIRIIGPLKREGRRRAFDGHGLVPVALQVRPGPAVARHQPRPRHG